VQADTRAPPRADESAWIACNNPRIASVAQYELFDDTRRGQFKTGLRFADGRHKPSLASFPLPIWVVRAGRQVKAFGQLRAPGLRGAEVQIQSQARASSAFVPSTRSATPVGGDFYW